MIWIPMVIMFVLDPELLSADEEKSLSLSMYWLPLEYFENLGNYGTQITKSTAQVIISTYRNV